MGRKATGFNRNEWTAKYKKENYYITSVLFPKEMKEMICRAASDHNESISEFIVKSVKERLEEDIQ